MHITIGAYFNDYKTFDDYLTITLESWLLTLLVGPIAAAV